MNQIVRIIVAPKEQPIEVYKIYNLELPDGEMDLTAIKKDFHDPVVEEIVETMPEGKFIEVMYHNGVIDPVQEPVQIIARKRGIKVEAAKLGHRYYGEAMKDVAPNKLVHTWFFQEPVLKTLKPRGVRKGMQVYDLLSMNDKQLMDLSKQRDLSLSLAQMKKLAEIQAAEKLPIVTDVMLETYAIRWSDHCAHLKWKKLDLFKRLRKATERIRNSNVVSAFIDNAGGWKFFGKLVAVLKLETHNSPSENEPYGGQLTKLGGVIRDILKFALGAFPIGNIELSVFGEFIHKRFPFLEGVVLSARQKVLETIRAISDYGNPMGIPMMKARLLSHPRFGSKCFALGGTVGLTKEKYAQKGKPRIGDEIWMVGNFTGNDGLHGVTVASGEMTEQVDTGDSSHVQIGHPFIEQKMMRAQIELMEEECESAGNDFGGGGIPSAIYESGEDCGEHGGAVVNLACVPLKTPDLENWQIKCSESQERFMCVIKPEKRQKASEIFTKYELNAVQVGIMTGNGRAQSFYDPNVREFYVGMPLSGEICFDFPYRYFNESPLPDLEVIEPPAPAEEAVYSEITFENVQQMAEKTVGHYDVCCQERATTQYDSTVQGKTWQGPLYGRNYNVDTSLSVLRPVYGRKWGLTLSLSFSPWQFEVDPIKAATNAILDAIATQVIAGVKLRDICLADNFYTPNLDPHAWWYLVNQVDSIASLSEELGTPFITGKDSSSGSSTKGGLVNVIPSVVITAMGKIFDVHRLKLHLWQKPGNLLYAIGPRTDRLDGSILSSALGITGTQLPAMPIDKARSYMDKLERLARKGVVQSAVPINRGGIFMKLFEGVEASGYGVHAYNSCKLAELFTESFGSVLVEIDPNESRSLTRRFKEDELIMVGTIVSEPRIEIEGVRLNLERLREGWSTAFQSALEVAA